MSFVDKQLNLQNIEEHDKDMLAKKNLTTRFNVIDLMLLIEQE